MTLSSYDISKELLKGIEEFSQNQIKRKDDLLILFDQAITNNKSKDLEETAFTAKYIRGLMRVLKSGNSNPEVGNFEQIKKDFEDNMKKVTDQLKNLITLSDPLIKNNFEKTFFELNQESFQNLNNLLADLEWTKMYLNDQKRKKQN